MIPNLSSRDASFFLLGIYYGSCLFWKFGKESCLKLFILSNTLRLEKGWNIAIRVIKFVIAG